MNDQPKPLSVLRLADVDRIVELVNEARGTADSPNGHAVLDQLLAELPELLAARESLWALQGVLAPACKHHWVEADGGTAAYCGECEAHVELSPVQSVYRGRIVVDPAKMRRGVES